VALPLLLLGRPVKWRLELFLLIGFLAWCALSLLWSVSWLDGIDRLWQFVLFVVAFAVATTLTKRQFGFVILGAGLGMLVNTIIVIAQFTSSLGLTAFLPYISEIAQVNVPAGLFLNRNFLAEAGLIIVAVTLGMPFWPLAVILLPALVFTQSKAVGLAAGFLGLLWLWGKSRKTAVLLTMVLLIGAGTISIHASQFDQRFGMFQGLRTSNSLEIRLSMWANSAAMIADKPWGQGIGGYWSAYPFYHDALRQTSEWDGAYNERFRPNSAHNDFLTLVAETGPGAFLLIAVFLLALRVNHAARNGLIAFLVLGLVNFPLYLPTTAFLAAICAGYLASIGKPIRIPFYRWGNALLQRTRAILAR
jgi:O-antigen ligase